MLDQAKDDLIYEIALNFIPQIGPAICRNIVGYAGSAQNFFEMPAGKAAKIPRISQKLLSFRSKKHEYLRSAEEIIQACQKKNIEIVTFSDNNFPIRLKGLDDCPVVLFHKGNINFNPPRTVGIVGTRNITEYGKSITKKIIEDLAPYAPMVISGLAYGVDIEAHRNALSCNLPTVAVLGSSVDQIYPSAHKSTAQSMLESGGILSEFPPGTIMHPTNFPKRNRIIAGLSDALIVVEAAKKGGALITAEIAYSYNKEVFAVPGNLQATYSEGCNNLIRSMKASIYTGPKDLEECLSWSKDSPKDNGTPTWDLSKFEQEDQEILLMLQTKKEVEIDSLALLLNMSVSTLAIRLLNLEFEGFIQALPGKRYKLKRP
ncbi:DNA-processing protein DprA [Cecembia calidifontis]|jgi:DNA processing protein|uniref:DNA processing protein n=1 Tax=Cecembia calidifontis TaxID=1187080 RepID=A0A4Q7PCB0_9BACT|nr:DNA-processing protein DprA [Cecembia calidifontis]RZS97338.1 DNA processing protein [Cecembia calidifontis]